MPVVPDEPEEPPEPAEPELPAEPEDPAEPEVCPSKIIDFKRTFPSTVYVIVPVAGDEVDESIENVNVVESTTVIFVFLPL